MWVYILPKMYKGYPLFKLGIRELKKSYLIYSNNAIKIFCRFRVNQRSISR